MPSRIRLITCFSQFTKQRLNKASGFFSDSESHKRDVAIDCSLLALIGCLSFLWFRGLIVSNIDLNFLPLSWKNFEHYFYIWDSFSSGFGVHSPRLIEGAITYYFPIYMLETLKVPLLAIENMYFYFWFTASGLSMYYFLRTYASLTRPYLLIGSIFYMMNPYSLVFIWANMSAFAYIYAFLPLILGLFIKGITEKRLFPHVPLLALIWTFSMAPAHGNPTFIVYSWLPVLLFSLFLVVKNFRKSNVLYVSKYLLAVMFCWAIFNAYWLIPLAFSHLDYQIALYNSYVVERASYLDVFRQNSVQAIDALRLTGHWGLTSSFMGDPYYPWYHVYQSPIFLFLSFLIPVLSAVALIRFRSKATLFCGLLLVVGFVLSVGSYPPVGFLTQEFFSLTGLIRLYYVAFPRFGVFLAVSFAALIALGSKALWNFVSSVPPKIPRRVMKLTVVIVIFCFLTVFEFPFFTGDVIYEGGKSLPSARIQIPESYSTVGQWLDSQEGDFKVLSLPLTKSGYLPLNWERGYYGTYPDSWFTGKLVINSLQTPAAKALSSVITSRQTDSFAPVLSTMNVRYVLLHEDVEWTVAAATNQVVPLSGEALGSFMTKATGFSLVQKFGNLTVYENNLWKDSNYYSKYLQVLEPQTKKVTAKVEDLNKNPYSWPNNKSIMSVEARYSPDWTPIVRTDGSLPNSTISFANISSAPYVWPSYAIGALNSHNSTIIYLTSGSEDLIIQSIMADNQSAYVGGAWWESDWMGMSTKPVSFPITIPKNEKAIIEVVGKPNELVVSTSEPELFALSSLNDVKEQERVGEVLVMNATKVLPNSYVQVSPVEYRLKVNSDSPFILTLYQSYDPSWTLFVNGSTCTNRFDTISNNYTNTWYVKTSGNLEITLYYTQQNFIFIGSIVTIIGIVSTISIWLVINRRRIKHERSSICFKK